MKKFILAITLVMASTAAFAQEQTPCENVQELAFTIMKVRQSGVPMVKMYKVAKGEKAVEQMVIAAYDMPQFNTESIKQRTIQDFADNMFLQCVKQQG